MNFKIIVSVLFSTLLFSFFSPAHGATLDPNRTCVMNLESGWNLASAAELTCGLMKISSTGTEAARNLPSYLDLYAYDGNEYVYARVTIQDLQNGGQSLENAFEKYFIKIAKKVTSSQLDNFDSFAYSMEQDLHKNNTAKIKEYAGRLSKEVFTSVWVYNPGKSFSVEYIPRGDDEEQLLVGTIRMLSVDISSAEISEFMDYLGGDEMLMPLLDMIEQEGEDGVLSFIKEIASVKILLDSGWNFLTYSRILSDNNGNLNFGSGSTCNISKAYVFDNSTKKWLSAESAGRSMIGSGLIVYNSGGKCTISPENSITSRLKTMLRSGADNNPPVLP